MYDSGKMFLSLIRYSRFQKTPAFYNRHEGTEAVLLQAGQMLKEGAAILDIGGQSTRPGSKKLNVDEELQRVIAPIEAVHKSFPEAIISIDTYYSKVAADAVAAGA